MVLVGYGSVAFNAISKTKMQMGAVPSMRGRVMALWSVAWVGSTPIGGPIVGFVGQHLGPRWSWYLGGIPLLVAGLVAMPYLIRLDAGPRPEAGTDIAESNGELTPHLTKEER